MNGNIATILRDLEEKNRLLKDRTLLIGENLIESKEEILEEIRELKNKTKELEQEIIRLKSILESLMEEIDNFARKSQLDIMERQLEMFSPLELARIKDVEKMIDEKLNKINTNKSIKSKIKKLNK